MKPMHIILVTLLSVSAALLTSHLAQPQSAATDATESAYDRIKRTGIIRCGYGVWEGIMSKDPTTGQLSGLSYDYAEALAKTLSLKIEWTEETGWNEAVPALLNNRIDVFCAGTWPNGARAREAEFTVPHVYNAIYGYVRLGDTRFDADRAAINSAAIKIASPDGYTAARIAETDFPAATVYSVVSNTSAAEQLETVATGKADITFVDAIPAAAYMAKNPGKIQQIAGGPFRVSPVTFFVKGGELRLKNMLDVATTEMLNSGIIEQLIKKHEIYPNTYARVRANYHLSATQ